MIVATVYAYGHGGEENWGDRRFLQLPAPGDVIHLTDNEGLNHYLRVRHTQHSAAAANGGDRVPKAIIITDWMEKRPPDELGE